jgi:hypothetical protein
MAANDFDFDDMMRKAYRDAILKADDERRTHARDSEAYRALSTVIEKFQEKLVSLQYKEPR